MSDSTFPLPRSWIEEPLHDVAEINPKLDKSRFSDSLEVSFVPMPAVEAETGSINVNETRQFAKVKKGYTAFLERDVLFAKITPCMENGKMAVAPTLVNDLGFGSTEFHVIRPHNGIIPEYIYYFVSSQRFRYNAEHNMTGAVGQRRVPTPYLSKHLIPVPPTHEQQRIVAKIEELFSELDKGIESLKTAREQLKVYRQAVLKHAFEGKLTAQWREDNKNKLETADQLLVRIQREREARYLQQIDEWKAVVKVWEEQGKPGKKPTKPRRQKDVAELTNEELANFSAAPNLWRWIKLGQLVWSVKDGPHYSPKYVDRGIPFISGGNIRPGGIDFETAKYISEDLHGELSVRCKPELGDILYTKGGTTGIARVNTYNIEFNVWVHVAVLKITDSLNPFYLQHALNSPFCYQQSQKYTHGVGNQDLGLTRMVNIILPLCSEAEQTKIIEIVECLTSEFDALEESIEDQLGKCASLHHSILKKAFSGQLVEQDPNDEPASILLERIQVEKEKQASKKKAPRRKAATSSTRRRRASA